jgi:hypothetical protein
VDQPSESVCAATTPSLQPYEPSAWIAPSAPPTSPEAPKDVLLAPIIAVAERLSKLVLTDDDGDKEKEEIPKEEIPGEDIPKEEKPKSTGAIPKEKTGGAKGRSKRPPSIATSDEEYVPAGLNGSQPPLRHGTVAERLAATGTHPRAAQTISGPPEIVVGEAGYSPPSTPPSLGHWQGLEVGGAKDPRGYYYPLKKTTQEEDLQLALALAADAEIRKEPEKKSRFHRVSPRTAALVQIPDDWAEKPINWADEVEVELPLVAESPDVVVEGDVITNGRLTNSQYHEDAKEAYELLCHWQQRVACGLQNARSILQEIYDLTQLSDWQGHFNGNWSLRRRFVGAITQYRRVVYLAHVLDELGAFDDAYSDRITWLRQRCRELLRILGLHLLVIEPEDLDGWASYDPPRASDPTIYGEVVWPAHRRQRLREDSK